MIEHKLDKFGKIIAYVSWHSLDAFGCYHPKLPRDLLVMAYIDGFWVHRNHRKEIRQIMLEFIEAVTDKHPNLQMAYFEGGVDRKVQKLFTKDRMFKLGGKNAEQRRSTGTSTSR